VRRAINAVNRQAVLTYVRTMDQQVDASIVRERMLARVSAAFSLLALLLATVGLYGTISYGVARRTPEIGICIALGATQAGTRWRVVRETVGLVGDRNCHRARRHARCNRSRVTISVRRLGARSGHAGSGGRHPAGDRVRRRVLPGAESCGCRSDASVAG
jgi:hypothetical protein